MSVKIVPSVIPSPMTCLAWNGADFVAVKCDASGRLSVRGENQLFSYSSAGLEHDSLSAAGGTDTLDGGAVPGGTVHVITAISVEDETNAVTSIDLWINNGTTDVVKLAHAANPGAGELITWTGPVYLDAGSFVRAIFTGTTANDVLDLYFAGYSMSKE